MTPKHTLGIDEAGRGPAIGPMVMAAVVLDTQAARALSRAGLRDSKSYGSGAKAKQRRLSLAQEVRARATFLHVEEISVSEIDRRVAKKQLNALERDVAEKMIALAPEVDRIVADGATLFSPLCHRYQNLEALNNGESQHAAVAAASVLAKTRRDQIYEQICARYQSEFGELRGGGYVNDGTRNFLRAYAERHGCLPPEARRSWPHPYLREVLGEDWTPWSDRPEDQPGQLSLL